MDEEFTKIMQNTDPHSQGKLGQAWASVRGKVQGMKLRISLTVSRGPALPLPQPLHEGPGKMLGPIPIASDSVGRGWGSPKFCISYTFPGDAAVCGLYFENCWGLA